MNRNYFRQNGRRTKYDEEIVHVFINKKYLHRCQICSSKLITLLGRWNLRRLDTETFKTFVMRICIEEIRQREMEISHQYHSEIRSNRKWGLDRQERLKERSTDTRKYRDSIFFEMWIRHPVRPLSRPCRNHIHSTPIWRHPYEVLIHVKTQWFFFFFSIFDHLWKFEGSWFRAWIQHINHSVMSLSFSVLEYIMKKSCSSSMMG